MEKEFREIVKVISEAKKKGYVLDFALIGALALSAFTEPRATNDMDFIAVIEKDKIDVFVDWLKRNKGYGLTKLHKGRSRDKIKNLIEIPCGSTTADIIAASHDLERDAISAAIRISVFGKGKLKVASPEYLIILKLFAGGEQDIIDCASLWNEPVDKKFVRAAARKYYLEGRLKRAVAFAKKMRSA